MRILIAAGGTAGHVNPALAIAAGLRERHPDAVIAFAGRKEGMEYGLVTKQGYPFYHIEVQGIQRRLTGANIRRNGRALALLCTAGARSRRILRDFKPDLVVGTGGYVSGPVLLEAARMKIRTAVHEQNAFPGVTNRLLAKRVDLVFAAMPDAVERLGFPEKTVVTGNPVRPEILRADRAAARKKYGLRLGQVCLLSFGGSLGAETINRVTAELAAWHIRNARGFLQIHATGQYGVELFAGLCRRSGILGDSHLIVREYIDDMADCLAASDLVIGRSGAITVSELAAAGRASVLIPSPNVAENHQYYNALQLAKPGAAVLIEEKDLTAEKLISTVDELTADPDTLRRMGETARSCAHPDSLQLICDRLEELMRR